MSERCYRDRGVTANNRTSLLSDGAYFSTELIQRLERLVDLECSSTMKATWQQSSALARRIRGELRREADLERERAKTDERKAA